MSVLLQELGSSRAKDIDIKKVEKIIETETDLTDLTDLNKKDPTGKTAVWWCCYHGLKDILSSLLKKKCDIFESNNTNETPLMVAAQWNRIDIVNILVPLYITKYYNIEQIDNNSNTALMKAIIQDDSSRESEKVLKILMEKTKNFNIKNKKNNTILLLLAKKRKFNLIEIYYENFTFTNDENTANETILFLLNKNKTAFPLYKRIFRKLLAENNDPVEKINNEVTQEIIKLNEDYIKSFSNGTEETQTINIKHYNINPDNTLVLICHGNISKDTAFCIPEGLNVITYNKIQEAHGVISTSYFMGVASKSKNIPSKIEDTKPHLYTGGDFIMDNSISFNYDIHYNTAIYNPTFDVKNIKDNCGMIMLCDIPQETPNALFYLDDALLDCKNLDNSINKEELKQSVNYIYDNYWIHSSTLKAYIGNPKYEEYIKETISNYFTNPNHNIFLKDFFKKFHSDSKGKIKNIILLTCRTLKGKSKKLMDSLGGPISRLESRSPSNNNTSSFSTTVSFLRSSIYPWSHAPWSEMSLKELMEKRLSMKPVITEGIKSKKKTRKKKSKGVKKSKKKNKRKSVKKKK